MCLLLTSVCILCLLQMLKSEGLHKYIDARALQAEIQEAADMTPDDMDRAANELIVDARKSGGLQPSYYEHLGGYSAQEMRDYNQYSSRDETVGRRRSGHVDEYDETSDDQMVYVTTL
jgi:hypothetical protein